MLLKRWGRPATLLAVMAGVPGGVRGEGFGQVRGYVFEPANGRPATGMNVEGSGARTVTNAQGVFTLTLAEGVHPLRISGGMHGSQPIADVPVIEGETTELIVTLGADGAAPQVLCEAASRKKSAPDPEGREKSFHPVRGQVLDMERAGPIAEVGIYVRGLPYETQTDGQGRFELALPEGAHDLSFIHPRYGTQTRSAVEVKAGREPLRIELAPLGIQMEDWVISAPRLAGGTATVLDERRQSLNVSDVLGAEQMAKTGDSDAAGALRRVTGLTVVDGKFVYVRGMGERYSATLLNGSTLPSPEPEKRVVPADLFPAALIESMAIQKTYSPDRPGEFGGGAIEIRTRTVPEEFTARIGLSGGITEGTAFQTGLSDRRGRRDFLGDDDGVRALPSLVDRASARSIISEASVFCNDEAQGCYSPERLEAFGEAMPNYWNARDKKLPPDMGLSGHIGDRFAPGGGVKLGGLAAFYFNNRWDNDRRRQVITNVGAENRLEAFNTYDFRETVNTVKSGGLANLGAALGKEHRVGIMATLNRVTDNEVRIFQGFNRDVGDDIRVTRFRFQERQLTVAQASGRHAFPAAGDLEIDWRLTRSQALRDEPNRRETQYDYDAGLGTFRMSDRPSGNERVYSNLEDNNDDGQLDVSLPFPLWKKLEGKLKLGVGRVDKDRAVDTRRFKFKHKGSLSRDSAILILPAEEIFTPEHIGPDGFQFEEVSRETDAYAAEQRVSAWYGMVEWPLWTSLRLGGGARVETSRQTVSSFQLFNPAKEPERAELKNTDTLPTATLTWEFRKDMFLRGGFSKTVSRPEFRELSTATFNDVVGGRLITGNPNLRRTVLRNWDARAEWYPTPSEIFALGFFHKDFTDPIEQVVQLSAQHSITYQNSDQAVNRGVELEIRRGMGFLGQRLRDFSVAINAAWIRSEVRLNPDDEDIVVINSNVNRPLQGQSPYVYNLQLAYDNTDGGTSIAVLYNRVGERITEVAAQGAPDVYEQPFDQVDLVLSQKFDSGLNLSLRAGNLLDPPDRETQGNLTVKEGRKGRSYNLGLSWNF